MNPKMNCLELTGLDGSNPLAFLAALGFLVSATAARRHSLMSWDTVSRHPRLHGWVKQDADLLADTAMSIVAKSSAILSEAAYPSTIPALEVKACRTFASAAIASSDGLHLKFAASLSCDGARTIRVPNADQKKRGELAEERASGNRLCNADNPGGKRLIGMFRQFPQLLATPKDADRGGTLSTRFFIREVMEHWKYHAPANYKRSPKFPAFRWDPAENRPTAYGAEISDGDNLPSVPGANAMAVLGLTFFVSVPTPFVATLSMAQDEEGEFFAWPLWEGPLSPDTITSLLAHPDLWLNPESRSLSGISEVFRCTRHTTDNGSHFFRESVSL